MADETTRKIVRSRRIGLRDIYIATVTQNDAADYTTATPIKLGRALSAKISDKFNSEKVYSDDNVEDIIESYEGSDIELSVNALAPDDFANLYNNLYKDGYLLKSSGDVSQEVAFGYRSKKRNGKYEFVWYYCGHFERPEEDLETLKEKFDSKTPTIKGTFYARTKEDIVTINGETARKNYYSITVHEDNLIAADTTAKAAIADWFGKVQEYTDPAAQTTGTQS